MKRNRRKSKAMTARLRIQTKIVVGAIGIVVLLGLSLVIFAKTILYQKLLVNFQKRGIVLANGVALDSINPILTEKQFALEMMVKDVKASEDDIAYIFVLDSHSKVLAHTFEGGFPVELKEIPIPDPEKQYSVIPIVTENGEILDIAVPLWKGEVGVVHVGFSGGPLKKDIGSIITLIIWFIIIMLVTGTVLAIVLSKIITKPVIELAKVAKAVGSGDLTQRVHVTSYDEIGEMAITFNTMLESRKKTEEERERLVTELQDALDRIKTLSGLLHICAWCKNIRDDKGRWMHMEEYVAEHSDAEFSHGICPECLKKVSKQDGHNL
jgi:methyl-accepting chemotaxis protein